MVKLEETTDEYFEKAQAAEDDEWQDDDQSEFVSVARWHRDLLPNLSCDRKLNDPSPYPIYLQSDEEEEELEKGVHEETFLQRLYALRDVVPPSTRQSISNAIDTASNYAFAGGSLVGKIAWVVTTSALLVGLPFALAVEDEARYAQQEREFQAQQSGASVSPKLCSSSYSDPS